MGYHLHLWCPHPPEGEVRRSKTWDKQEWDEEEMVTNARVLEDIEDLRLKIKKDPGFRDSCSWPTLTEWCSLCLEMRFVKFVMPDDQVDNTVKDIEVIVRDKESEVTDIENEEVKEDGQKKSPKLVIRAEKCPDAGAKEGSSEPRARRRRGGTGSRMRRLLVHQLLITEKRGLPLSRLLCPKRTEARSQMQGRREQEESASPILRRRRSKAAGGERGAGEMREEVEERKNEVGGKTIDKT